MLRYYKSDVEVMRFDMFDVVRCYKFDVEVLQV